MVRPWACLVASSWLAGGWLADVWWLVVVKIKFDRGNKDRLSI